ncbi:hypothetical protein CY0110_17427 [Crocosphaera chwakensis CCY0110]|uniref:Uncharacterized protein n=1 Tax=Crocosphaera chwakensis CCY0110 TaxID=391612 RepID=A3IIG7_9CHRO|nr:hypothetical protein CY0110_17427 [Crocosphaera chwakensis CCY0110]
MKSNNCRFNEIRNQIICYLESKIPDFLPISSRFPPDFLPDFFS